MENLFDNQLNHPPHKGLQKKIDFAIKLLRSIPQDGDIEISYSSGKDSDVILELAKMAGIPYRAIYKSTTIDPPGCEKHCRDKGVEILKPKRTFFELVRDMGMPSMYHRICCGYLKEYKVLDRAVHGIRRCESRKRNEVYKEPETCRVYSKTEKVKVYMPILEWSDQDVEEFIQLRNIKCHPLYYDEQGNFHVERRLGCIGCPLKYVVKQREDYKKYPKFLRRYIHVFQEWIDAHPDSETVKKFPTAYHKFYYSLFCKSYKDYQDKLNGGLFPDQAIDPKKFLEEYFGIDL